MRSILRTWVNDFTKVKSGPNPVVFNLVKHQNPKENRTTDIANEIHNSFVKGHQIAAIFGSG